MGLWPLLLQIREQLVSWKHMVCLDYWNRSGLQYFTIQALYMGRYSPGIGSFIKGREKEIFGALSCNYFLTHQSIYVFRVLLSTHNIIQLMHSFEVNIRICKVENRDVH